MRFLQRFFDYASEQWRLRKERLARREAQKSSGGAGPAPLTPAASGQPGAPPLKPLQALDGLGGERRAGDERGHEV